jgi:hypothetical protein
MAGEGRARRKGCSGRHGSEPRRHGRAAKALQRRRTTSAWLTKQVGREAGPKPAELRGARPQGGGKERKSEEGTRRGGERGDEAAKRRHGREFFQETGRKRGEVRKEQLEE